MSFFAEKAFGDRLPTEIEIENAAQIKAILASQFNEDEPATLPLSTDDGKVENVIVMPALAASLLELLGLVSSGWGVRTIPAEFKLTTQQAADLLDVPHSFLLELLKNGDIPFTKSGRGQYVQANDLFSYKKKCDAKRSKALDDIVRFDQEEGLI